MRMSLQPPRDIHQKVSVKVSMLLKKDTQKKHTNCKFSPVNFHKAIPPRSHLQFKKWNVVGASLPPPPIAFQSLPHCPGVSTILTYVTVVSKENHFESFFC